MKVQLAVLADQANVAPPGKLNIMGIFDTIGAEKFPTTLAFMVLAIRLKLEYEDREKTYVGYLPGESWVTRAACPRRNGREKWYCE